MSNNEIVFDELFIDKYKISRYLLNEYYFKFKYLNFRQIMSKSDISEQFTLINYQIDQKDLFYNSTDQQLVNIIEEYFESNQFSSYILYMNNLISIVNYINSIYHQIYYATSKNNFFYQNDLFNHYEFISNTRLDQVAYAFKKQTEEQLKFCTNTNPNILILYFQYFMVQQSIITIIELLISQKSKFPNIINIKIKLKLKIINKWLISNDLSTRFLKINQNLVFSYKKSIYDMINNINQIECRKKNQVIDIILHSDLQKCDFMSQYNIITENIKDRYKFHHGNLFRATNIQFKNILTSQPQIENGEFMPFEGDIFNSYFTKVIMCISIQGIKQYTYKIQIKHNLNSKKVIVDNYQIPTEKLIDKKELDIKFVQMMKTFKKKLQDDSQYFKF